MEIIKVITDKSTLVIFRWRFYQKRDVRSLNMKKSSCQWCITLRCCADDIYTMTSRGAFVAQRGLQLPHDTLAVCLKYLISPALGGLPLRPRVSSLLGSARKIYSRIASSSLPRWNINSSETYFFIALPVGCSEFRAIRGRAADSFRLRESPNVITAEFTINFHLVFILETILFLFRAF